MPGTVPRPQPRVSDPTEQPNLNPGMRATIYLALPNPWDYVDAEG